MPNVEIRKKPEVRISKTAPASKGGVKMADHQLNSFGFQRQRLPQQPLELPCGFLNPVVAAHRAHAKRAMMKIPSREDYEQRALS
jgi:hypothetical protein